MKKKRYIHVAKSHVLYQLLRIFVWLGLKIYCRTLRVNRPDLLGSKGPLMIASNHPDAILDALILGSLFHEPVYFLARGDSFRNRMLEKLLTAMHLIPVHRLSEGKEYLGRNDASFARCRQILSKGGILLVFAEGYCRNEWMLRPVKKGPARIVLPAMQDPVNGSSVRVLPVSINYSSFDRLGKTVLIHFGEMISVKDIAGIRSETEQMHRFNALLKERLSAGMLQSASHTELLQSLISHQKQRSVPELKKMLDEQLAANPAAAHAFEAAGSFAPGHSRLPDLLLFFFLLVPAAAGWLLHVPLYFPLKKMVRKKTRGTVYFDSLMFIILLLTYPIYWLLLNIFLQPLVKNGWANLALFMMPLLAWVCVYWRVSLLPVAESYIRFPSTRSRV
jgi:1-acyl-sn-glycerol-3-phosphate acyltransferase